MWSLWQDWCSVIFSDPWSHYCEGFKKNSRTGSLSDLQELRNESCTFDHIKANSMRSCILHRLCPIIRFASEDITLIRSRIFGKKSEKRIRNRPKCKSLSSIRSGHKFNPSRASGVDPTPISLPPPPVHFSVGQFQIEPHPENSPACDCRKTLRNPDTLKSWKLERQECVDTNREWNAAVVRMHTVTPRDCRNLKRKLEKS